MIKVPAHSMSDKGQFFVEGAILLCLYTEEGAKGLPQTFFKWH